MRIAFFTDTYSPEINGVTNTLDNLSRYLKRKRIEHIFFAPEYEAGQKNGNETDIIRFKGIAPLIYPECRVAFPSFARIMETLRDFEPDLLHIVTELGIGLCGLLAARELKLPIVMSYHTNYDKYLDYYHLGHLGRPVWAYVRWFHSYAAVNLCPSCDTAAALFRRGFPNLGIWSRGIDREVFNPSFASEAVRESLGGRDKTIFLYVGRIAREKGLDTLVESIRIANGRYPDDSLYVFTGDGPYLTELQALQIPNAVFTGAKRGRELSGIYASCDAFLFPSGSETFGNVLLEAMASGLPGICADRGGVTDFAVHGENALVCRCGDAGSLAAAIMEMMRPETREKIRRGARRTAEQRSWDSVFSGLMEHYEAAVDGETALGRFGERIPAADWSRV